MECSKRCHLLELPRELRNNIYDHLTTDTTISPHSAPSQGKSNPGLPVISLFHTTTPAVLRLCRQVYDEYREQVLPRSVLNIVVLGCQISEPVALKLKNGVPAEALRKPENVLLTLSWANVMLPETLTDAMLWLQDRTEAELQAQDGLDWTPTLRMSARTGVDIGLRCTSCLKARRGIRF